ncbi:AI-2E family transporter [Nocardioides guangzhouensis]|uniref:AI-2E family transporter n=1 Tax=Nocardioides guangzhouensis TaxID=2497878 RepID=UPI001FE81309|nr:AI-2E family transporter [Nocardioides guangzhouensis]
MSNEADGTGGEKTPGTGAGSRASETAEELDRSQRERAETEHAETIGERFSHQLAQQWAAIRAQRNEPVSIATGPSNFTRAQVPWGLDLAAAWSWRLLVIGVGTYVVLRLLTFFAVVTLPLVVALLIAALANPVVHGLRRIGLPSGLAAGLVVLAGLLAVAALLTFVGREIAAGAQDLSDQVVKGLDDIREWLRDGPLHASDSQIDGWIKEVQRSITERSKDAEVVGQVTEVGTAVGHVVAGFFIVLFSTYFFLADGERIWAWLVRVFPRAARRRVDSSGRIAWVSLTQFVRATVLVALTDAVGIMIVAAILKVPFVLPIGVLVFLGAFVPMVGATVAGTVAVLVALVAQGPLTALLMLGGVILVQQIEGHILQPFLMGRFVSLHPLGVIVAIACGVLVAGIAGALVAVPLAAVGNAVVQHLAGYTLVGDDEPEERLEEDRVRQGEPPRPEDHDDTADEDDRA